MGTTGRIVKNSFLVLTARVSEVVFSLIVFIMVARYLGVEGFGTYSFIMAAIWVLSPLLFLGLNQILARDVSLKPGSAADAIGNSIVLNLIMTAPLLACSAGVAYAFDLDRQAVIALFITAGMFIPRAVIRNFFGAAVAREDMKYLAIITLITRITEIALVALVIVMDMGFVPLFTATLAAEMLGVAACVFLSRRLLFESKIRIALSGISGLFRECLPVTVSLFLVQAFLYVNVFVLKILSDDMQLGLFQGPHKILTRLQALPMAFFIASLPVYSRLAGSRDTIGEFNLLFEKMMKWILIAALPLSLIGVAFSTEIIRLSFGEKYLPSSRALQILLLAVPGLCLTTLQRYLFIALKRQRVTGFSDALCVACNLILDVILVPSYGYIGASIGTVAAINIQCLMNFFFLREHLKGIIWQRTVIGPSAAAAVLALPLFGMSKPYNLMLLPFGVAAYVVSLMFFRTISRDDMRFTRKAAIN
ncbi:MAG: flippase [Nitrospirae bacterium]|nr:flippase [Nitrospirota bacterium]